MNAQLNDDVQKVLDFMHREIPADKLLSVALAVADIMRLVDLKAISVTEEPIL